MENRLEILLDFDGTMFNTLPVHYQFLRAKRIIDLDLLHKRYIANYQKDLEQQAVAWRNILEAYKDFVGWNIISESSQTSIFLYLNGFQLNTYFNETLSSCRHSDGSRKQALLRWRENSKVRESWLISDSPKDFAFDIIGFKVKSSRKFFENGIKSLEEGLSSLRQEIRHAIT